VLPTDKGWDHLVYASTGVMTVETDSEVWVIPPHRALWAPDATSFRIHMHGRVSVRTLYFRTELGVLPATLQVVNVPSLVRELVLTAVREAPLDLVIAEHRRLVEVLSDRLALLPQAPLQLPTPVDSRAQALMQRLTGAVDEGIESAARHCGASRRTLERIFVEQTGLTIGAWRRRARFIEALRLLAQGEPVTTIAHRVGYATPSAFTHAFRREFGEPPGLYFRRTRS